MKQARSLLPLQTLQTLHLSCCHIPPTGAKEEALPAHQQSKANRCSANTAANAAACLCCCGSTNTGATTAVQTTLVANKQVHTRDKQPRCC
jgi:hypothetical protein